MLILMSIHNFQARLRVAHECLRTLSERNRQLIKGFEEYCFSTGLSVPRIVKYLYTLKNVAEFLGKDLDQADKKTF